MLFRSEIEAFFRPALLEDQASIKRSLKDAVALVKKRGEKDNVTVVLIRVRKAT